MLTNSILVRAKDQPELYGYVVSSDIISTPVKDEVNGGLIMEHKTLYGVCWIDHPHPAIQMHEAEQLEWVEIIGVTDLEDDELDMNDELETAQEDSETAPPEETSN